MEDIKIIEIGPIFDDKDFELIKNVLWVMSVPEKIYKFIGTDRKFCIVKNVDDDQRDRFLDEFKKTYEYLKTF